MMRNVKLEIILLETIFFKLIWMVLLIFSIYVKRTLSKGCHRSCGRNTRAISRKMQLLLTTYSMNYVISHTIQKYWLRRVLFSSNHFKFLRQLRTELPVISHLSNYKVKVVYIFRFNRIAVYYI